MAVIAVDEDRAYAHQADCSLCGERLLVPFVTYSHKKGGLCLCSECCTTMRRGLVADMVQTAAIIEMGLPSFTLVRSDVAALKVEALNPNGRRALASVEPLPFPKVK